MQIGTLARASPLASQYPSGQKPDLPARALCEQRRESAFEITGMKRTKRTHRGQTELEPLSFPNGIQRERNELRERLRRTKIAHVDERFSSCGADASGFVIRFEQLQQCACRS